MAWSIIIRCGGGFFVRVKKICGFDEEKSRFILIVAQNVRYLQLLF